MVLFRYRGLKQGQPVRGIVFASSLPKAEEKLLDKDIFIQHLGQGNSRPKVRKRELLQFSQGMTSLLRAGVPLADAGDLWLEDHPGSERWQPVFEEVRKGVAFSEALSSHLDLPPYLVAMVRIGEETGTLRQSFQKISQLLKSRMGLEQTIISATVYPAIVLNVAVVAITILFVYVLPIFEDMYGRYDTELPAVTQALIATISAIRNRGWFVVLGTLIVLLLGVRMLQHTAFREHLFRLSLGIPWLGSLLFDFQQARMAQTLAHLLGSGVVLLQSLRILEDVVTPNPIKIKIKNISHLIEKGISFSFSLEKEGLFTRQYVKMISLGEQSASLEETFSEIGDMLQGRIDAKLTLFSQILEPVLIVGMALIIGFILVILYLPMFDVVQVME